MKNRLIATLCLVIAMCLAAPAQDRPRNEPINLVLQSLGVFPQTTFVVIRVWVSNGGEAPFTFNFGGNVIVRDERSVLWWVDIGQTGHVQILVTVTDAGGRMGQLIVPMDIPRIGRGR